MMSPSEEKGRAMGIELVSFDKLSGVVRRVGSQLKRYKYLAKFRIYHNGRQELQTPEKSRAGAWRTAVRWCRLVRKGKL